MNKVSMKWLYAILLTIQLSQAIGDLSERELQSVVDHVPELDKLIHQVMEKGNIPGLAIVVIEDNKLVLVKGYGVKEVGKSELVDGDTLFAIGSLSKSMLTMMMAKQIDRGEYSWDTPVKSLYPKFILKSGVSITMEDLVCNCTGYSSRIGGCFMQSQLSDDKKLFGDIAKMEPLSQNNEGLIYNNQFFAAAGYIVTRDRGSPSYIKFVEGIREELFEPLDMLNTTASIEKAWRHSNFAVGHKVVRNSRVPCRLEDMEWLYEIAPAGSIYSSANDLAKYIMLELNAGAIDGHQIISRDNVLHRREGLLKHGEAQYKLGWYIYNWRGIQGVYHNGDVLNYHSYVKFLPDKKSAVAILFNAGFLHEYAHLIYDKVFELWFDVDEEVESRLGNIKDNELLYISPSVFKDGIYQSTIQGYALNLQQKKALDKILGWHECEYGRIQIYQQDGIYFIKGKTGFNILSSSQDGGEFVSAWDMYIQLEGDSFNMYKAGDRHLYQFVKVD